MDVYSYNCDTNEYIGIEFAQEDIVNKGHYLLPAKSTTIKPPECGDNQVVVFETDKWTIYSDYRGQKQVNLATSEITVIDYIGAIKDGYQLITDEMAADATANPDNYGVINGVFQDITNTVAWREQNAVKVKAELLEYNYQAKVTRAYGGVFINYNDTQLVFETNQDSIPMISIALQAVADDKVVNWKFYSNNAPVSVPITGAQLKQIANVGYNLIDTCFTIEGEANNKVYAASTKEVNDPEWVELFKASVLEQMEAVPNTLDYTNLSV